MQRPYTNAGFGEDLRRMHPDKLGELFPAFRRGKNSLDFSMSLALKPSFVSIAQTAGHILYLLYL